ncbi:MAG: SHOCT domain-containing protein [Lachnospiraceae bacterium]|nr:SHOCT domain-containing protein [Lachnospiraceae bacterium]
MGLFKKEECVLCGGKAGLLTRTKLVNGDYICGDCRSRMPEHVADVGDLMLSEVEELISLKEENDRRYESEFTVTRQFDFDGSHPMIAVDDNTGEFVWLKDSHPDIFSFDYITGYSVDLHTRPFNEEERKKNSSLTGILNFFLSDDFKSRYPDLPRCPTGCKVTGMYFDINFGPNPLHADKLHIDMLPGWSSSEAQIEKAYICANNIYQCIKEYKEGSRIMPQDVRSGGYDDRDVDVAEQLKKMKELLDMGILTQDEFDAKKKQLLGL